MTEVMERVETNEVAIDVIDVGPPRGVEMEKAGVGGRGTLILPSPEQLQTLKSFGEMYVQSGLLPAGIKSWQAVAVTIQHGMDLGIPVSTAIQQIYVINGRPTCSSALMASLIYRDHGGDALKPVESTEVSCTYAYKRRGWPDYAQYTFTIDDAKRANLLGKDVWKQFPKSMLAARCVAGIAHGSFQDTIGGLYLRDEIEPAPVVPIGGDASPISQATAESIEASGNVIEGQIVERASKEQLLKIKDVADILGLTTEQLQFKVGKPSKELTPAEAETLYRELVAAIDQKAAATEHAQADPATGELPSMPAPDKDSVAEKFRN